MHKCCLHHLEYNREGKKKLRMKEIDEDVSFPETQTAKLRQFGV